MEKEPIVPYLPRFSADASTQPTQVLQSNPVEEQQVYDDVPYLASTLDDQLNNNSAAYGVDPYIFEMVRNNQVHLLHQQLQYQRQQQSAQVQQFSIKRSGLCAPMTGQGKIFGDNGKLLYQYKKDFALLWSNVKLLSPEKNSNQIQFYAERIHSLGWNYNFHAEKGGPPLVKLTAGFLLQKSFVLELQDGAQDVLLCHPTRHSTTTRIVQQFTRQEWQEVQEKRREERSGSPIAQMKFRGVPDQVYQVEIRNEVLEQYEKLILLVAVIIVEANASVY